MLDLPFRPDPRSEAPVYRQLAEYLLGLIDAGRLRPGERLPASRELAAALGLSRNTVSRALDALAAAGLLDAQVGRGTFVEPRARRLRDAAQGRPASDPGRSLAWPALLSARARGLRPPADLARGFAPGAPRFDFRPGRADAAALPIAALQGAWQRALGRLPEQVNAVDPFGHAPLRAALASALGARGIACSPDEILVTGGAQQAFDLIARALVEPGDAVALEQPGWFGAALAFRAAGADLLGVSVDGEGLRVAELERLLRVRRPKLVVTTPAVQMPTGVTLSDARREALLALADRAQLPIVEDDFDGELRLAGPARPALKTLDRGGQVLYVGTFSKALFPGLRLGYLVAPRPLLGRLATLLFASTLQAPLVEQLAVTELLGSGLLERHVRRARRRLGERLRALRDALAARLPEARVCEPAGGTCVWVELPPETDVAALAAACGARGVAFASGASCRFDGDGAPALLLSFAALDPDAIRAGVGELAAALRPQLPPPARRRTR
ncbi:MAG: PLP-dependent aminotransferase family protein [Deltaproteobacteria bacterium]|nr:PLP-dependent aminotransferase family protein [Deltaproteobacteria bacterium]